MSETQRIKFPQQQRLFFQTLRMRVDQYLKEKQVSKHANANMVIKTIFMFCLYFVPYFLLVLGVFHSVPLMWLLSIVMGFGMAGIGLSVMHDANHGSYSKNPKVNKFLSYTLNMLGGHYLNWQMQHNTLHHTFTNIEGHDEDIDAPAFMLRFSPHADLKKIHRFQFLYAWFFYGLLTVMWGTTKDFQQLERYKKMGLLATYKEKYSKHLIILIISKLVYYAYMIVIPMIFIDLAWWKIMIGFLSVQFTAGLLLSSIFQSAHVVEETKYPLPDKSGNMENDWAVHQLFTTANFSPKSRIFSWYVGGLNYQVEHHLFPSVCHVHYRHISKIVKNTAKEYNFPYYTQPTFVSALWSHTKMLWRLGRPISA
ncbi:MAG TPA: acyl-CoA desaturase [Bacteroidia bacterium]|jgi:linoleoyl-CoA desaturase|nr:acyl-CoA desaturase [Bacteroidia bacterium]